MASDEPAEEKNSKLDDLIEAVSKIIVAFVILSPFIYLGSSFIRGRLPEEYRDNCHGILPSVIGVINQEIAVVVSYVIVMMLLIPIARIFGWKGDTKSKSVVWIRIIIAIITAIALSSSTNVQALVASLPMCKPLPAVQVTATAIAEEKREAEAATAVQAILERFSATGPERVDVVATIMAKPHSTSTVSSTPTATPTSPSN